MALLCGLSGVYAISYKPFIYKDLNFFEAFNEFTTAILCYMVVPFTDYNLYSEYKYEVGKAWIAIFLLNYFSTAIYLLGRTIYFFARRLVKKAKQTDQERRMIYKSPFSKYSTLLGDSQRSFLDKQSTNAMKDQADLKKTKRKFRKKAKIEPKQQELTGEGEDFSDLKKTKVGFAKKKTKKFVKVN